MMKKYEHMEIKHEFDVTLEPIVNHVALYDGAGKKPLPQLKDKDFISTLNYFGQQGWAAVNFSHSINEDIVTSIVLLRREVQPHLSELLSAIENTLDELVELLNEVKE